MPGGKKVLAAEGIRFSYREAGSGPALVLLHGVGSGADSWEAQLEALSGRYRVVAWDAPGYGESTPVGAADPDADDYAARAEVLVRALGLDSITLVGHSLGAITAARFARRNPAKVSRLILASPSGGHARLPEEERIKLREGRLNDLRTLGPQGLAEKRGPGLLSQHATIAQRDAVVRVMAEINPGGYEQAVRLLGSSDTTADVEALSRNMSVEFVYGELDRVTTPDSIRRIAAVRPSAPVHVIPRAGHAVYIEAADAFNQVVLNPAATVLQARFAES